MEKVGFDKALVALEAGHRCARVGWNGKGMWIYAVPAASYPAQTKAARQNIGSMIPYGAYMAMKGFDGVVSPWLPSQPDLFAKDWVIFALDDASAGLRMA
jgi:hypothetical protein